jgi:uncharacterized protein (DUF2252 family)
MTLPSQDRGQDVAETMGESIMPTSQQLASPGAAEQRANGSSAAADRRTPRRREAATVAERVAMGKAARTAAPRSSHAVFERDPNRPSPLALLAGQDSTREPELVPIRYGRMAVSPFTYFRGAALPMASDLSRTPHSGLEVQLCGDAHLANFGLFASPERRLVFDVNDFDETLPGPWEWDVKRLAASLEVAARNDGYSRKQRQRIVVAAAEEYRRAMREFAAWPALRVWYAHAAAEDVETAYASEFSEAQRRRFDATVARARTRDNLGTLRKLTESTEDGLRFVSDPPMIERIDQLVRDRRRAGRLKRQLTGVMDAYRDTLEPERRTLLHRYRMVDMARKVVGVGSVGTRCWVIMLLGNDGRDPLFLQAKEAGPSVLEQFLEPSEYDNSGQRVVVGQRMMQAVSDIFLGWVHVTGMDGRPRDFYVRQLRDWKGSADVETMRPAGMLAYGRLCAWTMARAHARSGDPVAIAAYLGSGTSFETAINEFAGVYADQNERDYADLLAAVGEGRIVATPGK